MKVRCIRSHPAPLTARNEDKDLGRSISSSRLRVLLLVALLLLVVDVEVPEVVTGRAVGDDVEPVADLLLLKVLLGEVLEVPARAPRPGIHTGAGRGGGAVVWADGGQGWESERDKGRGSAGIAR